MSHSYPGEARGTIPITAQSDGCLTSLKKTDVRTFVNAIGQVINRTPLAVSNPWQGASLVRGAGLADAVGPAGARSVEESTARIKPAPVLCLLLTVVLLFGFQGQVILARPLLITLKAVPIILQSDGIFALGSAWAWSWKLPHKVSAPLALIGTSNFLELADAVATGLFGLNSGAEQRTTSLTVSVVLQLDGLTHSLSDHVSFL